MRWLLLFLTVVFLVSSVSAAPHVLYPVFSAAENGFSVSGRSLSVVDDAVYRTG